MRSTWDYPARVDEFLGWARTVARLENPAPVLCYSADKHYLGDLEARGAPVVATTFADVGEDVELPAGEFVVKPAVGAGARDTERYGDGDAQRAREHVARLHAEGRDAVLQPYVASVDEIGERAVIFLDGAYSHAMTKAALLNVDAEHRTAFFRTAAMSRVEIEPDALAVAYEVLDVADARDLLYARVDLVTTRAGACWNWSWSSRGSTSPTTRRPRARWRALLRAASDQSPVLTLWRAASRTSSGTTVPGRFDGSWLRNRPSTGSSVIASARRMAATTGTKLSAAG